MCPDHSPPSTDDPDDRGSPFWRHVSRVADRFDDLLVFLAIPILTALLEFGNVQRLLAGRGGGGFSIDVNAEFPSPLLDLWSFVDPPEAPAATGGLPGTGSSALAVEDAGTDGVTVDLPVNPGEVPIDEVTPELLATIGLLLVAYALVAAVLYAVYVGGIDRRLRGEPAAPLECASRYAGRFLGYFVVVFGAVLAVLFVFAALVVGGGLVVLPLAVGLLLVGIPAFLVLAYLFYAAPFLLVVADASVLEAFVRSYRLAIGGGSYLTVALWHLGVTLVASVPLSLLLSPGGPVALVLGLGVTAPLSLLLTATTTSFLRELVEERSTRGRHDGSPADSAPADGG